MTSFSRQKPLRSKNKQHTTVWNTTFYHPANFKLKRIKNGKVVPKWPLLASCLPTVFREVICNSTFKIALKFSTAKIISSLMSSKICPSRIVCPNLNNRKFKSFLSYIGPEWTKITQLGKQDYWECHFFDILTLTSRRHVQNSKPRAIHGVLVFRKELRLFYCKVPRENSPFFSRLPSPTLTSVSVRSVNLKPTWQAVTVSAWSWRCWSSISRRFRAPFFLPEFYPIYLPKGFRNVNLSISKWIEYRKIDDVGFFKGLHKFSAKL